MNMTRFVALLRGINVGGNKKVSMEKLREMLTELGFTNVKTLLNSGNVVFDSLEIKEEVLIQKIEELFIKTFGFSSKIMIRTLAEIEALIKLDPFKKISVTPDVRLYITFFTNPLTSSLKLPYESEKKDFQILDKTKREVISVLTVDAARTTDTMNFIEKEFGKESTTRNWNTVIKISRI